MLFLHHILCRIITTFPSVRKTASTMTSGSLPLEEHGGLQHARKGAVVHPATEGGLPWSGHGHGRGVDFHGHREGVPPGAHAPETDTVLPRGIPGLHADVHLLPSIHDVLHLGHLDQGMTEVSLDHHREISVLLDGDRGGG